jgi:hypothetical protein
MNLSLPNDALGRCRTAADIHDETHDQVGQVEAPVESVAERTEAGVLGVSEGLVGARDHRLGVRQHRFDPLELRQLTGLALPHDFDSVSAAGIGHCCKGSQAIAE